MKKSQRIQALVELKARHEKNALTTLAEFQQKKRQAQQQLEHLQQYRQEYIDKFNARSGAGINVQTLLEFRSFIDKLDSAIAGQVLQVQQCATDEARRRDLWEKSHQQTESMQKVYCGIVAAEVKLENKREQAESDDRSCRMSRGSSTGTRNA